MITETEIPVGPGEQPEATTPLRFVTVASLFDGHDAAINVMRRLIQDSGAEVVHLGHNRSVSDVVAAVCGQLAGAHYGATAIPQSWRNGLMEKDLIEGIADRLLAHALVSLSS